MSYKNSAVKVLEMQKNCVNKKGVIMKFLTLVYCLFFSLSSISKPAINIQNDSSDQEATHKALDYDRERELRNEKNNARLELKEYRRKIYQLKKEIAYEKEQAKEYISEIKALKAELKEDISRRNKLKEKVEAEGSGFVSFASQVGLGVDVTNRQGNKQRIHAYDQLIKVKKKKIRELRSVARKFLQNRKVKKLEIAELRNEMSILSDSHGLKIQPVVAKKRQVKRNISSK